MISIVSAISLYSVNGHYIGLPGSASMPPSAGPLDLHPCQGDKVLGISVGYFFVVMRGLALHSGIPSVRPTTLGSLVKKGPTRASAVTLSRGIPVSPLLLRRHYSFVDEE